MTVYNCGWLGVVPFKTQGPDNQPGKSIRTSHFETLIGTYDVSEIVHLLTIILVSEI